MYYCGLSYSCSKLFHDQNAMLFPEDSEILKCPDQERFIEVE